MKKEYIIMASAVVALMTTSCNEEPFSEGGEGNVILNTTVNSDMEVVTRADNEELEKSLMVWISNEKGLVRRYNSSDEIPSKIKLVSGNYIAEAWAGDSVPASFDTKWFKGQSDFQVKKGETANVTVLCKIANVGVSVKYDDNIENVLKNPVMVVGHQGGQLTYAGEDMSKRGYFMMPSFDPDLTYTLTGTQIDGSDFKYTGTIQGAKPATEYILNVRCNEKTDDVGGAIFTIVIDEKEIEVNHPIELVVAPKIQGYDFDINGVIAAEESKVGRRSVYVSSAAKLDKVVLSSEAFANFDFLSGYSNFNLLGMDDAIREKLAEEGINFDEKYDADKDQTLLQINFEEKFTNSLPNGDYSIGITATDVNGKSTEATMRILVSDASVITDEVDQSTISYNSVKITGVVNKDDVESIGFRYRKANEGEWIYVEGTPETRAFMKGTKYYAILEGLKSGTEYEYKAVTDDFDSPIINTFETLAHQQLPNAGFEEWSIYNNKIQIPSTDYSNAFWDCGNHGAAAVAMLGVDPNITTPSSDYKHSGYYSACLKTKFVLVKLAAGNIFIGKFVDTSGTNGITGFGRPFTDTPKSVKLWVKYVPGNKTHRSDNTSFLGSQDEGQIYIALADDTKDQYNGNYWPVIVNTGTSKYFDQNADNIIAYGEKIFTEAKEGDDLIQIEIKLDYKKDIQPSNIIFVASSSRYGDYFEGYDDSVMYLDDIELIYDE